MGGKGSPTAVMFFLSRSIRHVLEYRAACACCYRGQYGNKENNT